VSAGGRYKRFARTLRSGRLVSAAMAERLTSPKDGLREYGYGFQAGAGRWR
jgi:hypothetical protein